MLEEWTVERGSHEDILMARHTYELRNTYINRYVIYGEREYGINLVWSTTSFRDMFFAHKISQGAPVKFEEPVAIAIVNGGYLRYQEREYGINLVWSNDRIEEWRLTGGPAGTTIPYANNRFGLYNTVIRSHLVYCERTYGINLRWSKDCHRFDTLKTTASVGITYKIPLAGAGTEPSFGSVSFSGRLITPGGTVCERVRYRRCEG